MKIINVTLMITVFFITMGATLFALTPQKASQQNQESLENVISRFLDDYPQLQNASFEEVIEALQTEIMRLDQQPQSRKYIASNIDQLRHALTLIIEGALKSTHGLLIIGWIGGKLLVSYCGKLLWAVKEGAIALLQQHNEQEQEESIE